MFKTPVGRDGQVEGFNPKWNNPFDFSNKYATAKSQYAKPAEVSKKSFNKLPKNATDLLRANAKSSSSATTITDGEDKEKDKVDNGKKSKEQNLKNAQELAEKLATPGSEIGEDTPVEIAKILSE